MSSDIIFDDFYHAAAGGNLEEISTEIQRVSSAYNDASNIRAKFLFALLETADDTYQEFVNLTNKRAKTGRDMDLSVAIFAFRSIKCSSAAFYLSKNGSYIQDDAARLYVRAMASIRLIEHTLPKDKPSCMGDAKIINSVKTESKKPSTKPTMY